MGEIAILFDVIFLLVTVFGWYRVIKEATISGFKVYISNVWYILHLVVTICSTLAVALFIVRLLLVKLAVEKYNTDPERFASFTYIGQIEFIIMACMGFITFFTTLEFLRILRFNYLISTLLRTLSVLAWPLGSFFMAFCVIYMSYASFTYCLFVDKLEGYRTLIYSILYLLLMFMGQFDLSELENNAPLLGPLLFLTYMVVITMILINLFVGIICDTLAGIQEEEKEDDDEYPELMSALAHALGNVKSRKLSFGGRRIYTKNTTDWDKMTDLFVERVDSCDYLMNVTVRDQTRHQNWLEANENNKKTWCVILAILGSDIVYYEEEFYDGITEFHQFLKTVTVGEAHQFLKGASVKYQEEQSARSKLFKYSEKKWAVNTSSLSSSIVTEDIEYESSLSDSSGTECIE